MKDEYGGKSIVKSVGLKSKMYSILDESNNEKITSKGHNGFIGVQEFYDTLFLPKTLKYWVGVQWGQSYLMGRRCLFSLGWQPF